jgi:serine/threonine-protein phosphatase 6 regulatory subunit 3
MKMVDYVIKEPCFNDSPSRCFKYPFLTCQIFTTENEFMISMLFGNDNFAILKKLFSFISNAPNDKELNPTLGGYFNKIVSYWILKQPNKVSYI